MLQLENQILVTNEVEFFIVTTKVSSYNQIQENKLKCDDRLLELGLVLQQYKSIKLECDNGLLELGLGLLDTTPHKA